MSSEVRVVRPYRGVERLDQSFREAVLHVGDHAIAAGQSGLVPVSSYLATRMTLVLAPDDHALATFRAEVEKGLEEAMIPAAMVQLVAVASTGRLRLAEVVLRHPVAALDELPKTVQLADADDRPDVFAAPFSGCRLDLYLDLVSSLDPLPLRPWRKGTWLAHASFEVSTDVGDVGFTPLELTDEIKTLHGIPKETIRYVVVDAITDPDQSNDAVQLYVDPEVLAELAVHPRSLAAVNFQRQLFLDAVRTAVFEFARDQAHLGLTPGDLEGSFIGRLLVRVCGPPGAMSAEEYGSLLERQLAEARNDPAKFVARLEASVAGLRKGILEGLATGWGA